MAIFNYDNTINYTLMQENYYNDIESYFIESGTNIGQISGFSQLATFLIATAKKIGGKIAGKKNYTSKSIEYQIDKCKKLRNNIDEELEDLKNNNYKIKPSYVAKNFFGMFILLTAVTSIETIFLSGIYKAFDKYKLKKEVDTLKDVGGEIIDAVSTNKKYRSLAKRSLNTTMDHASASAINDINSKYKDINITTHKIMLVVNAIIAAGTTAFIIKDYEKSLIEWRNNIDKNIKILEKAHKKALEKEAQK